MKRAVQTAADMYVRIRGRKHKVEEYKWDRKRSEEHTSELQSRP